MGDTEHTDYAQNNIQNWRGEVYTVYLVFAHLYDIFCHLI